MITDATISEALKARYVVTQITSEKAVKSAFNDVLVAYIVPAIGEWTPEEEGTKEETLRDDAVAALTYARLLYIDVAKYAYATAKAGKENTTLASADELKRAVASYRRMGITALNQLRDLLEITEEANFIAILGELI